MLIKTPNIIQKLEFKNIELKLRKKVLNQICLTHNMYSSTLNY